MSERTHEPPISVLDLVPVIEGGTAAAALRGSLELARLAERLGYRRFWVAEHHGMPGVASAATAVVIGHLAAGTSRIRVGSGGIMLPNHAPLVIAEQFGTLESLHPGRIDLGLGRAPGSDAVTMMAIRGPQGRSGDTFPRDVQELLGYFRPGSTGRRVRAVPGEGLDVPVYLLGSSTFSAQLAAALGLPFAFAAHFAPDALFDAAELYRDGFRPSAAWPRPHFIVALNVVVADSDADARRLFTSLQQQFLNLVRGEPRQLPPPVDSMEQIWSPAEAAHVRHMAQHAVVGTPGVVRTRIRDLAGRARADEIMATAHIFDQGARLRSFELLARALQVAEPQRRASVGPASAG